MKSDLSLGINSAVRLFVGITLFFTATFSFANDYESGHQALQLWDEAGQSNAPAWVQLWYQNLLLAQLLFQCYPALLL